MMKGIVSIRFGSLQRDCAIQTSTFIEENMNKGSKIKIDKSNSKEEAATMNI